MTATAMKRETESRIFAGLQFRAEGKTSAGAFTEMHGRAVPYGTTCDVGWYLEEMAAGVFDKSISEAARALPLLLFHDHGSFPIGAAVEWRSESDGLYGTWKLDSSPEAQRAARMADEGMLTGLSVGFAPVRSEWQAGDPDDIDGVDRVIRHEARLLEVSIVPTPAYAEAGVSLVRTAERPRHARKARRLDNWKNWRTTL